MPSKRSKSKERDRKRKYIQTIRGILDDRGIFLNQDETPMMRKENYRIQNLKTT